MRGSIAGLAVALSFGVAAAQVPQSPDSCRAFPDYGDNSIIVEWDDVNGELGYRVYRAESMAGPFEQVGGVQLPDDTTLTDLVPDPTLEYFYLVRAFNLNGESGDSNIFQQNVKVVWPYPGHFALLHNWNDTIGRAGIGGQGYHNGVDIQQLVGGAQGQIVFPRGGIVSRIGNLGADNNFIFVEVKIGAEARHDSFNHLDGPNENTLGFDVGDYVRAGESLGSIGDDYFTDGSLDWVDHVHFYAPNDPFTGVMDGQNPLKIFLEDHERDPQNVRPGIFDHLGDGTVLYHRQDSAPGPPYLNPPLGDDPGTAEDEGNVDIHIEIADDQNGGVGTTTVPTQVAYWVEGRNGDGNPPVVRDPASPYVLMRWDHRFYRDEGINYRDLMDEEQDISGDIEHGGVNYPSTWENFKHFIVTNTSGTDGEPQNVDPTQHWNTNAADDGSAATVAHANFAGMPDASRAQDARFLDGDYTIHVISTDLLGSRAETIDAVRLENFPPAIRDRFTADDVPPGSGGGAAEHYRIEFSEPMDQGAVGSAITFERVAGGAVTHTMAWSADGGTLSLIPNPPLGASEAFEVTVNADVAADLEGKLLDSEFGHASHNGTSEGDPVDSITGTCTFTPLPEVTGVTAETLEGGGIRLAWPGAAEADTYSVTRGVLSTLTHGQYGSCLASVSGTTLDDGDVLPPDEGFVYLVQVESDACGVGTLGTVSAGERVNGDPASCD